MALVALWIARVNILSDTFVSNCHLAYLVVVPLCLLTALCDENTSRLVLPRGYRHLSALCHNSLLIP